MWNEWTSDTNTTLFAIRSQPLSKPGSELYFYDQPSISLTLVYQYLL